MIIGTSVYQLITFRMKDIKWFLENVKKNGGNATEVFLIFSWQDGWRYSPFQIVNMLDQKCPLYDLTKWNEKIWSKWREIFRYCKRLALTIIIRIHDFVSIKDREYRYHLPFRTCVQRMEGRLTGGLWGIPIRRYYHRLNKRLVTMLNNIGVDYYLVPMNEAGYLADPGDTEKTIEKKVIEFHNWYIQDLIDLGCPKSKIIISTSWGFQTLKKQGCVMEIHGVNSPQRLRCLVQKYQEVIEIERLFPNGDGIDPYALGRRGDKSWKREPSVKQAHTMAKLLVKHRYFGYCYFNRNVERVLPAKLRQAKFDVLAEFADTIFIRPVPKPEPIKKEILERILEPLTKVIARIREKIRRYFRI